MQLLDAFSAESPTASLDSPEIQEVADLTGQDSGQDAAPAAPAEAAPQQREAAELLWTSTLRRLAAIEADGILERRKKPAKLAAWLEGHEQRMRTELRDAAEATGRDINDFVEAWGVKSRDLLLECLRSGKAYEEVTQSWTERTN
jgi:hypothetical protein